MVQSTSAPARPGRFWSPHGRGLMLLALLPWAPLLAGIVVRVSDEHFWASLPFVLLVFAEWPAAVIAVAARSVPLGARIVWQRALLVFILGLALRLAMIGWVLLGMIET